MNTAKVAKNAAKLAFDPFEAIATQSKPIFDEARDQMLGFFTNPRLGSRPKEIAKEDLYRAREFERLEKDKQEDTLSSKEKVKEILAFYKETRTQSQTHQNEMRTELNELKTEVVELAKASGVKTNIHLENTPKVGKIDISFITFIVRILKVKAQESKSAKDLVSERSSAKRTTGMLAWVSGKQMKIHEQGTMQLQG